MTTEKSFSLSDAAAAELIAEAASVVGNESSA
jgi:hypothetical protein